jgi:hypothetical protein
MIRCIILLYSCITFAACSSVSECDSRAIELATEYESQLFLDKAEDRQGFYNLAQKLQSILGTPEEAYLLLKDKKLEVQERDKVLKDFGPLLLMMAISRADRDKVNFYLNNGVDSLVYHKHLGVLILDLLEVKDKGLLYEFKDFYYKNDINSALFEKIAEFYGECVS